MSGRRALISREDLARMASAVAEFGVVFKGRVDPLGNFSFTIAQQGEKPDASNDDLDSRLDDWAGS